MTEKRQRAASRRLESLRAGRAVDLEMRAVRRGNLEHYHRERIWTVVEFCRRHRRAWTCDQEMDHTLVELFQEMYDDGAKADEGGKVLSSLAHFMSHFSRKGAGFLPRAASALKGWRALSPSQQRLPLPRLVMLAIAGRLLRESDVAGALMMVVSFIACLRPYEARQLLVRHLAPPSTASSNQAWGLLLNDADLGVAGKTGITDECVLLDDLAVLAPMFKLRSARAPDSRLFEVVHSRFQRRFAAACAELGLEPVKPSLYALRHGGASEDLSSRRRSPLEVQLTGRWRTMLSSGVDLDAAQARQRLKRAFGRASRGNRLRLRGDRRRLQAPQAGRPEAPFRRRVSRRLVAARCLAPSARVDLQRRSRLFVGRAARPASPSAQPRRGGAPQSIRGAFPKLKRVVDPLSCWKTRAFEWSHECCCAASRAAFPGCYQRAIAASCGSSLRSLRLCRITNVCAALTTCANTALLSCGPPPRRRGMLANSPTAGSGAAVV